jgi:hypothetical protein
LLFIKSKKMGFLWKRIIIKEQWTIGRKQFMPGCHKPLADSRAEWGPDHSHGLRVSEQVALVWSFET